MSEPQSNQPDSKRTSDAYKMVVFRSEDFQEVRSMDLTLGNIYVLGSIVMLLLCGLIYSLIAFTPVKRLIPGYGKLETNGQFMEMIGLVNDLDNKIEAQGTYIEALGTIINTGTGEVPLKDLPVLEVEEDDPEHDHQHIQYSAVANMQPKQAAPIAPDAGTDLYQALSGTTIMLPVEGIISSEYDPAIKHYGVDILAPAQTPIVAILDGIVVSSGWDLETGYSIGIQHQNDILTFYKHNSQLLKEEGSYVKAGEVIAIIGNTGTVSSGPHLHFEVWHDGKSINPKNILNI